LRVFPFNQEFVGLHAAETIGYLLPKFPSEMRCKLEGIGHGPNGEQAFKQVMSATNAELKGRLGTLLSLKGLVSAEEALRWVALEQQDNGSSVWSEVDLHSHEWDSNAAYSTQLAEYASAIYADPGNLRNAAPIARQPFLLPVVEHDSPSTAPKHYWAPEHTNNVLSMRFMFGKLSSRLRCDDKSANRRYGRANTSLTSKEYPRAVLSSLFPNEVDGNGRVSNDRYVAGINERNVLAGQPVPQDCDDIDLYVFDRERRVLTICEMKYVYGSRRFAYYATDYNNFGSHSRVWTQVATRRAWAEREAPNFDPFGSDPCQTPWEIQAFVVPSQFPVGKWFAEGTLGDIAVAGSSQFRKLLLGS
jgi:hypothetical protein